MADSLQPTLAEGERLRSIFQWTLNKFRNDARMPTDMLVEALVTTPACKDLLSTLAQMTRERDAAVAACAYTRRSILRFPGSVHDTAVAKIDKALGYPDSVFVDAQEARIVEVTTARDAAVAERDQAIKDRDYAIQRAMTSHGDKLDAFRKLDAAVAREARLREAYSQFEAVLTNHPVPTRLGITRILMLLDECFRAALATSEPEGGA